MHAAECDNAARKVLRDAYALNDSLIYYDAAGADAAAAAPVDLFVLTPECVNFSARNHGRDAALVADGGVHVDDVLAYVRTRSARVVVVENVAEKDGAGAIETALWAVGGYVWYTQELCPSVHAGQPVRRARRFWVGVRVA